jgi:glycosyltransferase involved in cell wall biosynthesis
MARVSIIVPNYNHASYLEERLDSIFNQTFQDFEVILLDDASKDDSVTILKKYANDKRVSHFIINKKNSGSPFKQWDKGLKLAKGEYIWIAESDDSCELNFLESQLEKIEASDAIVAKTFSIANNIKTKNIITHPIFTSNEKEILSDEHFIIHCPIRNVSALVFKNLGNEFFNKITFSNYRIIGDLMFYYEVFNKTHIALNNNTISYFRQNNNGLSNIDTKGLKYYKIFFEEHLEFINTIFKQNNKLSLESKSIYIQRKFNKIKNRISFNKKISITYFTIYLKYKFFTFI